MSTFDNNIYINNLNFANVYLYRYIVTIFCILSNVGNFLNALIFLKKSWRKNVCVFYFLICLISNTIYINCYMIANIFINGFNINVHNSNEILCKLYYYIAFLTSTIFPTVLILASIDRLLISSQNVNTRLYSSIRLAYFSISINTFIWFIFFFHILIKVNLQKVYFNYFVCFYEPSKIYLEFVSYSSLIITSIFSFLMIILLIFAFKNVHHMRIIPSLQRKQIRSMTKKDFQLLRCLFVQDIVYIILSIFLNIYYVYAVVIKDQIQTPLVQAINNFLRCFLSFFHDIPFCISFFIFLCISRAFRNELKRMIYKIFRKNIISVQNEENKQENVRRDNVVVVSTIVL